MSFRTINAGAALLVALGCMQMCGDLAGVPALKALGAASHASPAPRVFTAHQGFETFSSRFFLHWELMDGRRQSIELTPETYARLHGPYNRRNAYGAAISYGPVLAANAATRPMFESVSQYALCDTAPVLKELGIETESAKRMVRVELLPRDSRSAAGIWQLSFDIDCRKGGLS